MLTKKHSNRRRTKLTDLRMGMEPLGLNFDEESSAVVAQAGFSGKSPEAQDHGRGFEPAGMVLSYCSHCQDLLEGCAG